MLLLLLLFLVVVMIMLALCVMAHTGGGLQPQQMRIGGHFVE